MRTMCLAKNMVLAGILGIAVGGCGNEDVGGGGNGGATSPSLGGTTSSGGSTSTGGSASGGVTGSGGASTQPGTGGRTGTGGSTAAGGSQATGGTTAAAGGRTGLGGRTGGPGTGGAGGLPSTGGVVGSGGATGGGATGATGGAATGGRTGAGGRATGGATGGGATGTAGVSGTGGSTTGRGGSTGGGTCTASKDAGRSVTGSGPHKVVVETNTDAGVSCGTIYRPADLGGADKYPIFVWGEGGCSRNGLSNQASMGEIASWGYFVVADGPPGSGGGNCPSIGMSTDVVSMAKVMIGYIDWAIAENGKSCSAYYGSLDPTKIASDGFSCGGLMAMGVAGDPRTTAFGYTSSGLTSAVASYYKTIHTPVKILLGGPDDVAYPNGMRDYDEMVKVGVKVLLLSKNGSVHGGDLSNGKGEFNTINLAWLNWQLKGDTGATGKALLIGSTCKFCNASGWEFKSSGLE